MRNLLEREWDLTLISLLSGLTQHLDLSSSNPSTSSSSPQRAPRTTTTMSFIRGSCTVRLESAMSSILSVYPLGSRNFTRIKGTVWLLTALAPVEFNPIGTESTRVRTGTPQYLSLLCLFIRKAKLYSRRSGGNIGLESHSISSRGILRLYESKRYTCFWFHSTHHCNHLPPRSL